VRELRGQPAASFEDFSFTYSGTDSPALEGVTFSIHPGELALIAGSSGGGKSTLLRAMIGLVPQMYPGELWGRAVVAGADPARTPVREMARHVGYVFQDPENQIFASTVEEDVAFGLEVRGIPKKDIVERVEEVLGRLGLRELRGRPVHELSDGQKQLVALAGVLALDPEILVLDEPTSMLDPHNAREMLGLVRGLVDSSDICAVVVEHRLGFSMPLADEFLVLHGGRLAARGPPQEVAERVELHAFGISPPIPGPRHPVPDPPQSSRVALELDSVHYAYPGGTEALAGVSMEVREGELVAIVGHNGSGKTTLVRHMNGLLRPSSGSVRVFGRDTKKADVADLARLVGIVFQNPDHQIFKETVEREVMFAPLTMGFAPEEARRAATTAMESVGISHLSLRNPLSLSGGERKRVAVASVLSYGPRVLVLDEPTVGQDARNRELLRRIIRDLVSSGRTVIVVTHDLDFIWPLDPRTIVIRSGRILADTRLSRVLSDGMLMESAHLVPPWLPSSGIEEESAQRVDGPVR
jgi:energy-coupling factor transport system ATP-binding protein